MGGSELAWTESVFRAVLTVFCTSASDTEAVVSEVPPPVVSDPPAATVEVPPEDVLVLELSDPHPAATRSKTSAAQATVNASNRRGRGALEVRSRDMWKCAFRLVGCCLRLVRTPGPERPEPLPDPWQVLKDEHQR